MKILLLAAAMAFSAPQGYETDFQAAHECRPFEGRLLWEGKRAYYLQACELNDCHGNVLSEDAVSAVDKAANDAIPEFEALCLKD